MPALSSWVGILWLPNVVMTAILAYQLWRSGLSSTYQAFSWFLGFELLRTLIAFAPFSRKQYYLFYVTAESIALFFYILMVLEIYTLVLQNYRGIQSFGRWMLTGALIVSMSLSTLSLYPDINAKSVLTAMDILDLAERGLLSGLVLLILLMSCFMLWFPIALSRNVVVHSLLFTIYFLLKAFAVLTQNLHRAAWQGPVNAAIFCLGGLCLLIWILYLRPAGEKQEIRVGHLWNRREEDRLIGQLQEINASLSRSGRS